MGTMSLLKVLRSILLYAVVGLTALWLGGLVRAWPMVSSQTQLDNRMVVNLAGETRPLLTGEPQLLYLYAPWCQICRLTIDGVASIDDKTVSLVAQSYDPVAEIVKFANDYPAAQGSVLAPLSLSNELKVPAYPAYVLVDGEGRVQARRVGYMPSWLLRLYLWWHEVY